MSAEIIRVDRVHTYNSIAVLSKKDSRDGSRPQTIAAS